MTDKFEDRAKAYICYALAAARDEGAKQIGIPDLWGSFLFTKMSWDTYIHAVESLADDKAIAIKGETIHIPTMENKR